MDEPGLDALSHHHALEGLKTANAISRVSQFIWRGIVKASLLSEKRRTLRILDIASGGGDVMIGIAKLAARRGVELEASGWDISSTAVDHARMAAKKQGVSCTFSIHDALTDELPLDFDIILSTLFLHHLDNDAARDLLRRLREAAGQCVLIDDLCRNRLGYFYAWTGARLLTRSRIVHVDGPLSVRAAYSIPEFSHLAREAGMQNVQFQRHWPQRFLMTWKR